MKRVPPLLTGILLIITSCAPAPVFRMQPEAKNTTFNQGTAYVHKQNGDVKMIISYYRHMGHKFAMDVEIDNRTDSVIRVDPLQFSYEAFDNYRGRVPDSSVQYFATRKAINPEDKILEKDKAISRKSADQKTGDLLFAIGTAANVASYVMADTGRDRGEFDEDQDRNAYNYRASQYHLDLQKQALRDQRKIWEIDALRKTDVFPGEYIRGYVLFKNEPDAYGYMIRYKNSDIRFSVFFNQWKYSAKNKN